MSRGGFIMSEHFLKLDPNNYNTELEYLLDNEIFKFEDYKEFYTSGKMSKEDFERVKEYYECL
jgi:5-methylcytosine-specific restriction endonuclease McrBC GTP-binding regulatory subunit McrB